MVTRDKKLPILTQIQRFQTVTPVRIHQWLLNDTQSLMWYGRGALLFSKVILLNFKVTRDKKIADFDPNWAFPDCNSSLNSPMALKWCTKLDVVWEVPYLFSRSALKFQGYTGQKKSLILTQIQRSQTVTPVWIHQWLLNDTQSFML